MLDINLIPYVEPIFAIAPVVVGSLIGAGANLLGNLFGGLFSSSSQNKEYNMQRDLMRYSHELGLENMDYQQKLAHQTFDYTQGKEASLNMSLMRNSPSIQKQAMIDAGVNPASQFGVFSGNLAQASAPTYTPQAGAPSAPTHEPLNIAGSFASLADLLSNIALKKAEARNLNADAKGKEIDNAGKEDVNELVSKVETHTDNDGNVIISWSKGATTKQGWDFKREFRRWATEQNELDVRDAKAILERKVAEGQLENDAVIQGLIQMPSVQLDKTLEEILNLQSVRKVMKSQIDVNDAHAKLLLSQNDMEALKKDILEHTNIYEVIKKLGSADTPWYEKVAMVVAGAVSCATAFR